MGERAQPAPARVNGGGEGRAHCACAGLCVIVSGVEWPTKRGGEGTAHGAWHGARCVWCACMCWRVWGGLWSCARHGKIG
eukprot:349667-Chlamydomonas_euryale.AAC.9